MDESERAIEATVWAQLQVLAKRCEPIVTKHTVCIYTVRDGLKTAGTGVLLRVAEKRFMVSAAHVMDLTFYRGYQFFAAVTTDLAPPIPLNFVTRGSSARPKRFQKQDKQLRKHDPHDFSVVELEPETADRLSQRYRYLAIDDLDSSFQIADGMLVYGFPASFFGCTSDGGELETFPMGFTTTFLQDAPLREDADKDIRLYYSEMGTDGEGGKSATPKPSGLSGSGIWRLARAPRMPAQTPLDQIRLVGILHRWRPQRRYFVGTSVARIRELLWYAYPELHSALALLRPKPRLVLP